MNKLVEWIMNDPYQDNPSLQADELLVRETYNLPEDGSISTNSAIIMLVAALTRELAEVKKIAEDARDIADGAHAHHHHPL